MVIKRKIVGWKRPVGREADWRRRGWRARWLALGGLLLLMVGLQWLHQQLNPRGGPVPSEPAQGHPHLVDGDSFTLGGEEVRLVGIDAPEGRQTCTRNGQPWPCGEESRRALARLIAGRRIVCRAVERDQHGRLLGICSAGDQELNREMVASGHAVAYGNYEKEQAAARSARVGLWSGQFQQPKAWRREHGRGHE